LPPGERPSGENGDLDDARESLSVAGQRPCGRLERRSPAREILRRQLRQLLLPALLERGVEGRLIEHRMRERPQEEARAAGEDRDTPALADLRDPFACECSEAAGIEAFARIDD